MSSDVANFRDIIYVQEIGQFENVNDYLKVGWEILTALAQPGHPTYYSVGWPNGKGEVRFPSKMDEYGESGEL